MLVREHALLAKAVEAEVTDFLGKHADLKQFGAQMIRHRRAEPDLARRHHLCRDRSGLALRSFSPSILPPYMRRSKPIETLLPILYLKGISKRAHSKLLS